AERRDRRPEDRRAPAQAIDPPEPAQRAAMLGRIQPGLVHQLPPVPALCHSLREHPNHVVRPPGPTAVLARSSSPALREEDEPVWDALRIGGDAHARPVEGGEQFVAILPALEPRGDHLRRVALTVRERHGELPAAETLALKDVERRLTVSVLAFEGLAH